MLKRSNKVISKRKGVVIMLTSNSNAKKNKIQVECIYKSDGKEYNEIIMTTIRQLISTQEFDKVSYDTKHTIT